MGGKRQDIENLDLELDEDIDEDEETENDQEDDDDEDDDVKPAPKRQPQPSSEMREIKNTLASLTNIISQQQGANAVENKQKVSKVDSMFATLIKNGYEEKDLAPMAAIVQALAEDIKESVAESSKADKRLSLDDRCRKSVYDAIGEHVAETPAVGWARDEIANRVRHMLANHEDFESARQAYAAGHEPTASDFRKATNRVIKTFKKESGIKSGESKNTEQLDVNSSSKKVSKVSKDGKVDVSKLNDFEAEIYQTTLNITKSEELAKDALKAVRGVKF